MVTPSVHATDAHASFCCASVAAGAGLGAVLGTVGGSEDGRDGDAALGGTEIRGLFGCVGGGFWGSLGACAGSLGDTDSAELFAGCCSVLSCLEGWLGAAGAAAAGGPVSWSASDASASWGEVAPVVSGGAAVANTSGPEVVDASVWVGPVGVAASAAGA